MAYDIAVPGYRNDVVNSLRLWAAKSSREFDLEKFNAGEYVEAVEDKTVSENISKVLYPPDEQYAGRELRLKQQYFFTSATIQDILRRFRKTARGRVGAAAGQGGHPAQRHPSRHRHPGADARARRRGGAGVGRAPGGSASACSRTRTTPCCRRRWRRGRRS